MHAVYLFFDPGWARPAAAIIEANIGGNVPRGVQRVSVAARPRPRSEPELITFRALADWAYSRALRALAAAAEKSAFLFVGIEGGLLKNRTGGVRTLEARGAIYTGISQVSGPAAESPQGAYLLNNGVEVVPVSTLKAQVGAKYKSEVPGCVRRLLPEFKERLADQSLKSDEFDALAGGIAMMKLRGHWK